MNRKPKNVIGTNNIAFWYWYRQLQLKLNSVITIENLPNNWDIDYFKKCIFQNGLIGVMDTERGVLSLECSAFGVNVFNSPTQINVANVVLGSFQKTIGEDCEIIYLYKDGNSFYTTNDLITRYSELLSQCDATLNTTLINSRVAHIFQAETDAEVKTYQKVYDEVTKGNPAVFLKKGKTNLSDAQNDFLNVKNVYIGNDILDTKRTIMNEFLTEIGLNNSNTDKKERLITDEVNANNEEVSCIVDLWINNLNNCFKKVNAMFNLNLKASKTKFTDTMEVDNEQYKLD